MNEIVGNFKLALDTFELNVKFKFPDHGITVLFGPSGSGKTCFLNCLAGIVRANGYLKIGREFWQNDADNIFRPTHRRSVGYVFQEATLFDGRTVEANLRYAQRRARSPEPFDALCRSVGITHLLGRKPLNLSGGEKQRVAIARALIRRPALLLMDEPLASLDPKAKQTLLELVKEVGSNLMKPVVYVTHSIEELLFLADYVVSVKQGGFSECGKIGQMAPKICDQAEHKYSIIQGRVIGFMDEFALNVLDVEGVSVFVPGTKKQKDNRYLVKIRPRDVDISRRRPLHSSILNALPCKVRGILPLNDFSCHVTLDFRGEKILSEISRKACHELNLKECDEIYAQIKSASFANSVEGID